MTGSWEGALDDLARCSILATDLDGTLLRGDGTLSDRTVATLAAAGNAGITVVAVTARSLRTLRLVSRLHVHGVAICANGAVTVDLASMRVIASQTLAPSAAIAIVASVRELIPAAAFAVETATGLAREPGYVSSFPQPADAPVGSIETLIDSPIGDDILKLLVRHRDIHVNDIAQYIDIVGPLGSVSISTTSGLLEIGPPGVTKASALESLAGRLGHSASAVTAAGDMPNDIPMIRWAGTGLAVANAHPEVIAAADFVIPSNDNDGVATVLEHMIRRTGR